MTDASEAYANRRALGMETTTDASLDDLEKRLGNGCVWDANTSRVNEGRTTAVMSLARAALAALRADNARLVRERDNAVSCKRGQHDSGTQFCAIAVDAIREMDEAREAHETTAAELHSWIKIKADAEARATDLAAQLAAKDAEIERLREAGLDTLASLVAAVSLLERGGKKAAASDKMFGIMLDDYRRSADRARAALEAKPSATSRSSPMTEREKLIEAMARALVAAEYARNPSHKTQISYARDDARAALAAIEAQAVVMPKEATEEMVKAVDDDLAYGAPINCYKVDVLALYAAMVERSPYRTG